MHQLAGQQPQQAGGADVAQTSGRRIGGQLAFLLSLAEPHRPGRLLRTRRTARLEGTRHETTLASEAPGFWAKLVTRWIETSAEREHGDRRFGSWTDSHRLGPDSRDDHQIISIHFIQAASCFESLDVLAQRVLIQHHLDPRGAIASAQPVGHVASLKLLHPSHPSRRWDGLR